MAAISRTVSSMVTSSLMSMARASTVSADSCFSIWRKPYLLLVKAFRQRTHSVAAFLSG